jgi:hypothetical protein
VNGIARQEKNLGRPGEPFVKKKGSLDDRDLELKSQTYLKTDQHVFKHVVEIHIDKNPYP